MSSARPNVIFLHTDQHTWDAVSAYGNRFLATPNIDRLHRNGLSFMRAYCTDPVCAPARTSWMTGRYSSETGVPFNGGVLYDDIPDLGQHLNAHGFPAYHSGKWHVTGRDVSASFRTLYFGKQHIGAGGGEYYDGAITRSVVEFLTRRSSREPFFLQIGMVNPHDVCEYGHNFEQKLIPDPVAQGILSADELPPLPANFHYDEPETMTHRVVRRDDDCLIHWPILRRTRHWSELQWRYLAWNLYRLVEKVDAEIGMVLAALEATGHADDTLILFTADHGEAAGQHQMFQKFTLYEESARVPFIAACLGDGVELPKGGYDREHFISGVDVFPTVCDYAGVAPLPGLPGRSIRPLLEGDATAWREHALVESNYWARAIITGRYKYVTEYRPRELEDYLPPGPGDAVLGLEQLFDLQHDPGETRNLAGDSGLTGVIADCRRRLAETEQSLGRRPLRTGSPRTMVENWGERLRQRWRQAE